MTYTPDAWVIVRIEIDGEIIHKVMGGWYGGYLGSDSWRLNSGITRVEHDPDGRYRIHGYSGSIYLLHPDAQRATMLMASVLERIRSVADDVRIVDVEEIKEI